MLPKNIPHVVRPPIKCQGVKTNLINFISQNIKWDGKGYWVEPFLGSGVVVFNIQPKKAILNDNNPHIINFYKAIYEDRISINDIRLFLEKEGKLMSLKGEEHYYEIRERFNKYHDVLDFFFLNRTCYNGLMRFNSSGHFNVPFCKNKDRFINKNFINKTLNRISKIKEIMKNKEWEFYNRDWKDVLPLVNKDDFVYLDPPYVGRHTDYYQKWSNDEAIKMAEMVKNISGGFAISMWLNDGKRHNAYIENYFSGLVIRVYKHQYQIAPKTEMRTFINEALLIKPSYES
jgi:DNA adenine methylase